MYFFCINYADIIQSGAPHKMIFKKCKRIVREPFKTTLYIQAIKSAWLELKIVRLFCFYGQKDTHTQKIKTPPLKWKVSHLTS